MVSLILSHKCRHTVCSERLYNPVPKICYDMNIIRVVCSSVVSIQKAAVEETETSTAPAALTEESGEQDAGDPSGTNS